MAMFPRHKGKKHFSFEVGCEEGLDPNLHTQHNYIATPKKAWQLCNLRKVQSLQIFCPEVL
jgi:hypothetical protein